MRSLKIILFGALAACGGGDDGSPAPDAPDAGGSSPDAEPAPIEVTMTTYLDGGKAPLPFVALQDGDGPWTVLASDDGDYSFVAATGRYALATVCTHPAYVSLRFFYATAAEQATPERRCSTGTDGSTLATVNIGVDGLADSTSANVWVDQTAVTATPDDPDVTHSVLPGRHDVWGVVWADTTIESVMVARDVDAVADAATGVTLDLDAHAVATSLFSIETTGATESDSVWTSTSLWSHHGTRANLTQGVSGYAGVPASALAGNDTHQITVAASSADQRYRAAYVHLRDPADVVVELPPVFSPSSVHSAGTTPSVRLAMTFDAYEGAALYGLMASQGEDSPTRSVTWEGTAGWLGDLESYSWEQPDLTSLEGWSSAWDFVDDVVVDWEAYAKRSTLDPSLFDRSQPPANVDGVRYSFASEWDYFSP